MEARAVLTIQNIEAELSYSYLHAIAARAGIICEMTHRHSDAAGIDAVLRVRGRLDPASVLTSFTAEVQLKATTKVPVEQNRRFSHFLERKNYDDLRSTATISPQLLVLLFLPPDPNEWLTHNEERLVAQRCAYWVSLRGAAETANETGQTIYIPRTQYLSVDNLLRLMVRFSRQEVLNYEQ